MNPERKSAIPSPKHPFGEICFEDELRILGPAYNQYYFTHVPFTADALLADTYLIVGRRGVGKSSLAHFFTFQDIIPGTRCVDVDEPAVYQDVLGQISDLAHVSDEVAIPQISKFWEVLVWNLAFEAFKNDSPEIEAACMLHGQRGTVSGLIKNLIKALITRISGDSSGGLADEASRILDSEVLKLGQQHLLERLRATPLIIAIDTLEHCDVENHSMMRTMAGLIECAKRFCQWPLKTGQRGPLQNRPL